MQYVWTRAVCIAHGAVRLVIQKSLATVACSSVLLVVGLEANNGF